MLRYKFLDVVTLTRNCPGLKKGQQGTVIHIFNIGEGAYEVEFLGEDGATLAIATLNDRDLQ